MPEQSSRVETRIAAGLGAAALGLRLLYRSHSLDEADSALFLSALVSGYDVSQVRPHPPGYPVYLFFADLLHSLGLEPFAALTLLSALCSSLTVVLFYHLLRSFFERRWALLGALLLLFDPLSWMLGGAALSDSMAALWAVLFVCLAVAARARDGCLVAALGVLGLAIGTRPAAAALVLVLIPVARWRLSTGRRDLRPWLWGGVLAALVVAAWAIPMVKASGGLDGYLTASRQQVECCVERFDVLHTQEPVAPNLLLRVGRYTLGYLLVFPRLGAERNDLLAMLALFLPALGMGLGLFFRSRQEDGGTFVAWWVAGLLPVILQIHLLARYGAMTAPATAMWMVLGYRRLAEAFEQREPNCWRHLVAALISTLGVLALLAAMPPIAGFEDGTSYLRGHPEAARWAWLALPVSGLLAAAGWMLYRRIGPGPRWSDGLPWRRLAFLALAIQVAAGFWMSLRTVPVAHRVASPPQRLAGYVAALGAEEIVICPGPNVWPLLRALHPEVERSDDPEELLRALAAGNRVLAVQCPEAVRRLETVIPVEELEVFAGESLLWAKSPRLTLLGTPAPSSATER